MDDHERAARLGRAWDTFGRGNLAGCDPGDLAMVRSLIALDRQPAPDPRFVAWLEGVLTGPGTLPQILSNHRPSADGAGSGVGSGDLWTSPEWSRRPSWTRWVAVGVVVLVCGALVFLTTQTGSNDEDSPTSLPAYGDGSAMALSWQKTPECDVPARSGDSFRTLIALSASFSLLEPPSLAEAGVPADAATVAVVEATMREILACRTERETGREYALYSNGALLRANLLAQETYDLQLLEGLLRSAESISNGAGTPEPALSDEAWTLVSIQDLHVLADGRVRATVFYKIGEASGGSNGGTSFVAFFVERDGIYLDDDAEGFTYLDSAGPVAEPGPVSGSAVGGMNIGQATGAMSGAFVTDYPTGYPPPPVPTEVVNNGDTVGGFALGVSGVPVATEAMSSVRGQAMVTPSPTKPASS